jgi:uracil-DNA glycosylase
MPDVKIDPSWMEVLRDEFGQPYWQKLSAEVRDEYQAGPVFPAASNVFRAFNLCPFDSVNVVIVGQDPYHGPGQANGLSFSVNDGLSLPPSLKNIFKEIEADTDITPLPSGDLTRWATQGVLLLNSVLTVAARQPASHAGRGWELFTDAVIRALNERKVHVVYMLWGKYAQAKGAMVDRQKNLVLTSAHPSPYSATQFFGHHHFGRCNAYLQEHGKVPIDWR